MSNDLEWVHAAVQRIETDFQRTADTHLFRFDLPASNGVTLYLKDESTHPTGSLKHRLARSLFLYGLCNGWITRGTTIIEASSGSTAVSEAYFAKMLGLPFVAVVPRSTSPEKIAVIEFYGGKVAFVDDATRIYEESRRLASEPNAHFMDQFTYAERATDWRGNNNIAQSIFEQLRTEEHPVPTWIVCSAGTGGTSATIGRYLRYRRLPTQLCVCDPEHSVFYDYYRTRDAGLVSCRASNIEGIGRPRVEPSFLPGVVDRMVRVPDAASVAAARFLYAKFGRRYGGSTGTNLYGTLQLASQVKDGSIVTLLCDGGDRYLHTYYDDAWVERMGWSLQPYLDQLDRFYRTGEWFDV